MKSLISNLENKKDVRSTLSELRKEIKDDNKWQELQDLLEGKEALLEGFLKDEDAKTRKNTALLIGDLGWQDSADALYEAYRNEDTRFVKSSYLQALNELEIPDLVPELKSRLEELRGSELTEENRKHVEEEIRQLQQIIIHYEGVKQHKFDPMDKELDILLVTNRNLREHIAREITEGTAKVHPLGVWVKTEHFPAISKLRTYRELLFPVVMKGLLSADPKQAAEKLWNGGVYDLLSKLHTTAGTFYYRVEVKSSMDLEKRSEFTRRFTAALDQISSGRLVNTTSDYEVEIRLIASKDGSFFPAIRLYTYKDTRFAYRRNTIAATMHPATAALIAEVCKPYLKEEVQVLDPFCGVGTLLIERNHLVPAKDMYAVDVYGEAISKGRENAQAAKALINFIHRDFFTFTHEYLFDEIITDMPMRGSKSKEEMDVMYSRFFRRMPQYLNNGAIIILYTNESAFVKKQLRLNPDYTLLQTTSMQNATPTKAGFDLFVLRYR